VPFSQISNFSRNKIAWPYTSSMMELMTDDFGLLQRYALDRDEGAFAEVVRRHVDLVHSASMRRIGERAMAEDVTQATFMILARKAKTIRKRHAESLSGWLLNAVKYAAANAIKMEHRRQKHEQAAGMAQVNITSGVCSSNPSEVIVWREIAGLLDDAVLKLSKPHRQAVLLRYFENQPIREMALQLQMSEGAVKLRLHRAIDKLRRILSKRGAAIPAMDSVALGVLLESHLLKKAPTPLKIACTAAGGAGIGAIGFGSATSIAKGTLKMMTWTKTQFAAGVLMLATFTGAGGVLAIRSALAQDQVGAAPAGQSNNPPGNPNAPIAKAPAQANLETHSLELPSSAILADTFVLINIDQSKLDANSIDQTVQTLLGPLAGMAAPKVQMIENETKLMTDAGIESLTIVVSGDPTGPVEPAMTGYVKLKPGTDHATVQQFIRNQQLELLPVHGNKAALLDMSDDGDFIVVRGKGLPTSDAPADPGRAKQFSSGLSTGNEAVQLVFVHTDKIRGEIKESVSKDPGAPAWATDLSKTVSECQSAGVGLSLGNSPVLELSVQAADADGAKTLANSIDQGLQMLKVRTQQLGQQAGAPQLISIPTVLAALTDSLKPKQEGTKVSLNIEGKLLAPAIGNLIPMLIGGGVPAHPPAQGSNSVAPAGSPQRD
jgi:RNA polymerase sigma factor (sigma-70 family)